MKPINLLNQADISREKGIEKSKLSRIVQKGEIQIYKIKGRKTNFFNLKELTF